MIRRGELFTGVVLCVLIACAVLTPVAIANHSATDLMSIGPAGGNAPLHDAFYDGTSADGLHVIFETDEKLVSGDTDSQFDIYDRFNGTTTLVSTGPSGGNGGNDVFFDAVSANGTHILFETDEKLVSGDNDNFFDIYDRSGGTTTLISTGSVGGNGQFDAFFPFGFPGAISQDGTKAFFETDERLVSADNDGTQDVYMRSGTTTTLISGGTAATPASFDGASQDASRAFFETDEPLSVSDADTGTDIYQFSGGTISHVSTGPAGGNSGQPAFFDGISQDGVHVFFDTQEVLTSSDTDGAQSDIYDRSGGNTTLVSTGSSSGGAFPANYEGNSQDGTRVFFTTAEKLEPSVDTDSVTDVYQRSGGSTSLISTGSTGGNGAFPASYGGTSQDGGHVFFTTAEPLTSGDLDTRFDLYDRANGATTLVSVSPNLPANAGDVFFDGSSADGARVFFDTAEKLNASDTDTATDLYERFTGATTRLSTGPTGGNGAFAAFFDESSRDGTRVFFDTRESLTSGDSDGGIDVYAAIAPPPNPIGASPMRISLGPAFIPCGAAGSSPQNATHQGPLTGASCSPPVPRSSLVAVGPKSVGFARLIVLGQGQCAPFDSTRCYPDVTIRASITDVRSGSPSGVDYDTPSTTQDLTFVSTLPDAGAAQGTGVRITDKYNKFNSDPGTTFDQFATVAALSFPVPLVCTTTTDTTIGSTCDAATTVNALVPGAAVAGNRATWELGQFQILDKGANGTPGGGDDKVFEAEGVFAP